MITKVNQSSFLDVGFQNEVYNFDVSNLEGLPKIGASSFLAQGRSAEILLAVLMRVTEVFGRFFQSYEYWLYVASDCVQPDTKMVRYKGLLGSLKSRGLDVPGDIFFQEKLIVLNEGVKFIGRFELKPELMNFGVAMMLKAPSSYVVAVPKGDSADKFHVCDIEGSLRDDLKRFESIFNCGGALIARLGFFDDDESGFLVLASPSLIMEL